MKYLKKDIFCLISNLAEKTEEIPLFQKPVQAER